MEILITVLAIVACVLLFSLAVFIHEFGHFLAARKLGLRVEAFSIGFGPALWKKKINGVEYRISLIPFGGYVSLPDLDPEGTKALEGETAETDETVADELPAWKKIIVAFAGPLGNIVLAVALALLLAVAPGVNFGEIPSEIGDVPKEGPAFEAGLKAGDKVKSVNGHAISTWSQMQTEVQLSGGKATSFVLDRAGEEMELSITPKRDEASGAYYILAFSTTNNVKASLWMPSRNPLDQIAWDAGQIFRVLKALVTPKESKAAASALGGPVMIAEGLYNQVRRNGWDALGFLRFLCINLAILNLLPIPVLDGGLILFALFELVTKRKVPRKLVNGLSQVFMYLFLGLMLFLVYRDIARSRRIHAAQDKIRQEMSEKAAKDNVSTNAAPNASGQK
jgi:regulator of sigma E protease